MAEYLSMGETVKTLITRETLDNTDKGGEGTGNRRIPSLSFLTPNASEMISACAVVGRRYVSFSVEVPSAWGVLDDCSILYLQNKP